MLARATELERFGFNASANTPGEQTSGMNAGPSFYLNNSSGFQALVWPIPATVAQAMPSPSQAHPAPPARPSIP